MKDLFNIELPKWPQMYVTGESVTIEQAKEIIRRTDRFFINGYGGNDEEYTDLIKKRLGIPSTVLDYSFDQKLSTEELRTIWDRSSEWKDKWGCIETNYVKNDWISCCFIYGAHGWCHPDGTIGYIDNIGKWPSIDDVLSDWRVIVKEFPFLDIGVTLMNRESCEDDTKSLVSIIVNKREVELVDPFEIDVHKGKEATRKVGDSSMSIDLDKEKGIEDSWIKEWEEIAKRKGLICGSQDS